MLTIRSDELRRLKIEGDKFDRKIIVSLRKQLKVIGVESVDEVKKTASEGGGPSRLGIAAGTGLTLSFAKRGGGVSIRTTNVRLDKKNRGFAAAYNAKQFRHPVFGNRGVFVEQAGRPYFGVSIVKVFDKDVEERMKHAIDDAVRALGGRIG